VNNKLRRSFEKGEVPILEEKKKNVRPEEGGTLIYLKELYEERFLKNRGQRS